MIARDLRRTGRRATAPRSGATRRSRPGRRARRRSPQRCGEPTSRTRQRRFHSWRVPPPRSRAAPRVRSRQRTGGSSFPGLPIPRTERRTRSAVPISARGHDLRAVSCGAARRAVPAGQLPLLQACFPTTSRRARRPRPRPYPPAPPPTGGGCPDWPARPQLPRPRRRVRGSPPRRRPGRRTGQRRC